MEKNIKRLQDPITALEWEQFNTENSEQFEEYNQLLNSWSNNKDIQNYIIRSNKTLSEEIFEMVDEDTNVFYCNSNHQLAGIVCISKLKHNNSSSIDYIVVNPNLHSQGIGSRMISSIVHNPEFFMGENQNLITTDIDKSNHRSQRVFLKNNFKIMKRANNVLSNYYQLYYEVQKINI